MCVFGGWALFDVPINSEACRRSKQHLAFWGYFQNNIISGYIVLRRQLLRVFLQIEFGVDKKKTVFSGCGTLESGERGLDPLFIFLLFKKS